MSGGDELERFADLKQKSLARCLGRMHDVVGHSAVPYFMGGEVDLYYFPNVLPGTALVTQDLIDLGDTGPRSSAIGSYELIAFTRLSPDRTPRRPSLPAKLFRSGRKPQDKTVATPFGAIAQRFCQIFTHFARYTAEKVIEPFDTYEMAVDDHGGKVSILLDSWRSEGREFQIGRRRHGLMLLVELLPTEAKFARSQSTRELTKRLKQAGHYPYSDLDRDPVA